MRTANNEAYGAGNGQCGFTLIEILIVTVVLAVLASLAYPSYQDAVRKSRRAEAQAALMELMQQQERHYSRHNSYVAFSSAGGAGAERRFKWFSGSAPADSAYEISGEACTGDTIENCIVLTARPGTDAVNASFRDPACGALTFSSTGAKGADRPDCWR